MDKHIGADEPDEQQVAAAEQRYSLTQTDKNRWQRIWPIIACGAGLFSDGYLNGVIGSVGTMLATIYPDEYANSPAQSNVASITFVGTLIGNLLFGWTSDHWSRKWSLLTATMIIIFFAILSTGAYGTSPAGLFAALTVYRCFLGIGIGGEYPAGSVAASESTGELKEGHRNRWFIMFTDVQIDFGFVVAAIVPMIVVLITGQDHLRTAWRICLGLGIIPPLSLLYLRLKLDEPESFKRETMAKAKTPWLLVIKFYWFRCFVISFIWLLYNFSAYSFGIFSSQILANLLGNSEDLWVSFGWNTLLTCFYMPGCILGAFLSDWVGPRRALAYPVLAQGIVGFIMAGCYKYLADAKHVAGFVVVFGIFSALGELGPGSNIGLIASKSSSTAVRGKFYGIAAAWGRVGAYIGSKTIIILYNHYAYDHDDLIKAGQYPFFISSTFCIVTAALAFFCVPNIGQNMIEEEDARFRVYLESHGYDTSTLGLERSDTMESTVDQPAKFEGNP